MRYKATEGELRGLLDLYFPYTEWSIEAGGEVIKATGQVGGYRLEITDRGYIYNRKGKVIFTSDRKLKLEDIVISMFDFIAMRLLGKKEASEV